jgi:DNA (cytosine-5)-methyltransferase 1
MKFTTHNLTSDNITVVNDPEQLKLFENDKQMNDVLLKYPRRQYRTFGKNTYKLVEPSSETSSKMKNVHSSNTKIEHLLEEELIKAKLNYSRPEFIIEQVTGRPDFVIPRFRIAIFCDGDFWHGRNYEKGSIKNNSEFWDAKIEGNILRDEKVTYGLQNQNWKVFRFWEDEIKKDASKCVSDVLKYIMANFRITECKFRFVDLFAGIGGFRIPLEDLGGKCLGFSEIDKSASDVYKKNFCGFKNEEELELGDITKLSKLPFDNIDLIVGGVPCQAWSVAGKMKGFEDPRGRLWNDSIRIILENQPKAFIFENVKGLIDPRNKKNLDLLIECFQKSGYLLKKPQLLNSYDFGLPQNRDRVFIVGIRKDILNYLERFEYPKHITDKLFLKDMIDNINQNRSFSKKIFTPWEIFGDKVPMSRNRFQKTTELNDFFIFCDTRNGHTTIHSWDLIKTTDREKLICMVILKNRRKKIYGDSDGNPLSYKILRTLINDLKKQELTQLIKKKILRLVNAKGYEFVNSKNSSGINGIYRIYLPHSNIFSTLTATGTKDMIAIIDVEGDTPEVYKKNFIKQVIQKKLYRSITAKEAGKLQGFPNWFSVHKDEKMAKKQFGNAVSTNVVYSLSKCLIETGIFNKKYFNDSKGKKRNTPKV